MTGPRSVRLTRGHTKDEHGICQPVATYHVPITYNPDLATKGLVTSFADPAIVLREWDEQVLLHEVLHLLLAPFLPWTDFRGAENPRHHEAVREVEVALTAAGWRFTRNGSVQRPETGAQEPCVPGEET